MLVIVHEYRNSNPRDSNRCTRSTHSRGRAVVRFSVVPGDHGGYPAQENPMRIILGLTFVVASFSGCAPQNPAVTQAEKSIVDRSETESAMTFNATQSKIMLDTRIPPPQCRRFDIAQGSIAIETLSVEENRLVIHYTPEIEGGYTVYECKLPISAQPVIFEIDSSGCPGEPREAGLERGARGFEMDRFPSGLGDRCRYLARPIIVGRKHQFVRENFN